jgi:hypothetical protein
MGLLDQIIGKLGGQEPVERLAREEADFDDPQSPDVAHWNELVGAAPPEAVQDAMAQAARRVDPQEYYEHITVGDTRRLGKWDNSISSLIILSGTWEFFDNDDFTGTKMATLGPGVYPRVTEKGLKDNSISSVRLVSPTARAAEGRRPR